MNLKEKALDHYQWNLTLEEAMKLSKYRLNNKK
jgi:hypothetical protein